MKLRPGRVLLIVYVAMATIGLVWAFSQVEMAQLGTFWLFLAATLVLSHWHLTLEGGVLWPMSAPISAAALLLLPPHLAAIMETCVALHVAWPLGQPRQRLLLDLANGLLPTLVAGTVFTWSGYRTSTYSFAGVAVAVGVLVLRNLLNAVPLTLYIAEANGRRPRDVLRDITLAGGWACPSMQLTGLLTALAYQYAGASSLIVASVALFGSKECAQLYAERRRLTRLALYDALANVGNRHAWDERLGRLMQQPDAPYFLATFDLDGLKAANDAFGHAMGDSVLRSFADHLAKAAGNDNVFRFGGDEFVVLLSYRAYQELGDLEPLWLRVIESFEEEWTARGIRVSASMGCALAVSTADIPAALHEADRAMYDRKRVTWQELGTRQNSASNDRLPTQQIGS